MSSSCKSLSKDKITIRVCEPHEHGRVLNFIRLHYYPEEPLTAGSEPKQQDKEDEDRDLSHISRGASFVALCNNNSESPETIVGAVICGPKGSEEAKHLFADAVALGSTKLGKILKFLACVERDTDVCGRFNVQRVLHVHVIGVHAQMRGQHIGHRLIEAVLNQAKRLNYEMVTADCTSFYSAKLFERMGFQCINIQYYKDYVDEIGKQVFTPDPPHECVKTFALQLKPI